MYRVWFCDLEKAIAALRTVVTDELFCEIRGNRYGDFVFEMNENTTYIVKHEDFSVWLDDGDWRNPHWQRLDKGN